MKVNVHLSGELRKEHKRRLFPMRVGDKVKVRKGSFKGTIGKVLNINRVKGIVQVEGAERAKSDGSKVKAKIHASNVELIELDLSDKLRKKKLKRQSK
jgi:ribosomal protein uL24